MEHLLCARHNALEMHFLILYLSFTIADDSRWEMVKDREAWRDAVHGLEESDTTERLNSNIKEETEAQMTCSLRSQAEVLELNWERKGQLSSSLVLLTTLLFCSLLHLTISDPCQQAAPITSFYVSTAFHHTDTT